MANVILSVLPTLHHYADAALISATGTQRRLQALMVVGWSLCELQRATGASALHRRLTREHVTAKLARTVRDFYDTHWNAQPPGTESHSRSAIARTSARVARADWLPPLAWDDETIDVPDLPAPARRPAKSWPRIHVDDIAELATQGRATWDELEHRVGAVRNSIEIALTRAGRTELIGRITSNRWVAA